MKKVETLRELQIIDIYIYKELREFCNYNGLQVYLHGGTLIGALRHRGFIPWDDDIDVCMSRPDYEKMMNLCNGKISKHCSVIDPQRNENFNGYIPVVVYNNSKMESGQYRTKEDLKIGISIFIYDGISGNAVIRKLYYLYMFFLRAEHALCRADFAHVNTFIAKITGPIFQRFFRVENTKKYKLKILRLQKYFPYDTCKYVSTNADYKSSYEVCKKEEFEKPISLSFENIESYTYSHYDSHLKKYYGDYLQFPPKEQQGPKHSFVAFIGEEFDYSIVEGEK